MSILTRPTDEESGGQQAPEAQAMMQRTLLLIARDNTLSVATGLSAFFLFAALNHWWLQPRAIASFMTPLALATSATLFALRTALKKRTLPLEWTHPVCAGIVALAFLNTASLISLTKHYSPNVMILIIATGALFMSRTWHGAAVTILLLVTALIARFRIPPSEWYGFAASLFTGTALSVLIHNLKVNLLIRMERLRGAVEQQKQKAETALQSAEREVAERRSAEAALRKTEQKYRSIFENAVEGIFQVNTFGQFISANPALARILGFASPEGLMLLLSDSGRRIFANPDRFEEMQRLLKVEDSVRGFEVELRRNDGGRVWILLNLRAVRNTVGSLLHYDGTAQDITESKRLEEQLRLSQKMEAVGQLAGGIAHDFNNVLTGIIGYTQLMLGGRKPGAPEAEDLRTIHELAERAAGLTQRLLAFSRRQTLRPTLLSANNLVENTSKMLTRVLGERIQLKILLSPEAGYIQADPGQIEQVLMNLVVNARDAMLEGGTLTLETSNVVLTEKLEGLESDAAPGAYVVIEVKDTGHGMDKATQRRIFEPFFTTKEIGKGTGLGLSTSYGIVRQHGGHFEVKSEPGEGTTFRIYLPRQQPPAPPPPRPAPEEKAKHPGTNVILLAEDESVVRSLVRTALERQGHQVLAAADPIEAENLFEQWGGKVSLLLTDFMMPVRNGRELYERLAQKSPNLKVMYMSGYVDIASSPDGLLTPTNAPFLAKPFTLTALVEKVREALEDR